ncbi:Transcriptional regulator, AbiEi antitoxin, Type IV TA system [Selenomonas sp. WCT3]|uniref:type IV toxin-antitoxin system AbiEi family antitoxin domain-containing protein n=1 Tax=Selenomonas sp. WCT3 TaxID=3158785 RepID=UPI000888E5A1|nr:Transcriptional regulator, AbiEi antitoxin, Type IV TA system [Selenomonas ruminantium]
MIRTTYDLLDSFSGYANPDMKIKRMVQEEKLFRLRRGLYVTTTKISPYLVAGTIYGPSYISFETALSRYGLIPERVYACTSATFRKNRSKTYKNDLGVFTYRDIPAAAFPLGVKCEEEKKMFYAIASPEKALCDMLYVQPPVYSHKALRELLFVDLRIDEDVFSQLDRQELQQLVPRYRRRNLNLLGELLSKGR